MVLQQAPNQANVWGYTSDCEDKVTVKFVQEEYPTTLVKGIGPIKVTISHAYNKLTAYIMPCSIK